MNIENYNGLNSPTFYYHFLDKFVTSNSKEIQSKSLEVFQSVLDKVDK